MTTNNQLLDLTVLKQLIGKNLKAIHYDEFTFTPVSYGAVYLEFNDAIYQLSDFYESKQYFGSNEDISVLKIKMFNDEIKSYIENHKIVSSIVNTHIQGITLVNTKQIITSNSNNISNELSDTIGIIFTLEDGYQFAFEKDDFGENISIYRGYNLKDKFKHIVADFKESISVGFTGDCIVEYQNI